MTLYIFDYNGTLTTILDPIGFIRDLRTVDPDCVVVLYTGAHKDDIDKGILRAVDDLWEKPKPLGPLAEWYEPERVVIVDDEALPLLAAARALRAYNPTTLTPEDLPSLLQV